MTNTASKARTLAGLLASGAALRCAPDEYDGVNMQGYQ
jgi:hypothetical protein